MHFDEVTERITRLLEPVIRAIAYELMTEVDARLQERNPRRRVDGESPDATTWMTATQVAEYLQLFNASGQPTTAGIMKWAKRDPSDNMLPHAKAGDLIRFNRAEVDRWAKEEAEHQRAAKSQRAIKLIK